MVKAILRVVKSIFSNADINDKELVTAFTAVESLIKSRALTYQSSHSTDDVPLKI